MVSPTAQPFSPFLAPSPSPPAPEANGSTPTEAVVLHPPRSPFISAFALEVSGVTGPPPPEEYAGFLAELHDHEFDAAAAELVAEATAAYETRRWEMEAGGAVGSDRDAVRLIETRLAPLHREADALLDAVSAGVGDRGADSLSEGELEALFDRYEPAGLEPNMEFFFGSLKKKLRKVASKAVSLAKKGIEVAGALGLKPVLDKLKGLVRPLLDRVLQMAIGKLPAALRPHAEKLRDSFLKKVGMAESPDEDEASPDAGMLQREFDERAAELLYGGEGVPEERFAPEEDPVEELNRARARFAEQVTQLRGGEDATPHVEQFIPAILPALKLGVKLAGRKRVVGFLAGLLGRLIERVVGKEHTPALSQAIVDAGLRLIHLEARPDDGVRAAGEAVAGTIEETVRRVAALPDYVLADERLMEGFVVEAFEAAAAEMLPPVLPERVYEMRPELRPSALRGAWVYEPLRGVTKRYQKYTRVPETEITPQIAAAVKSFGGTPLAGYLKQRFGLAPGRTVKARVHLYRAVPGTSLARIAALEKRVPAAARDAGFSVADFHPLTQEAAGYLLRDPGLGAPVPAEFLADRSHEAVGQRYYRLELEGAPIPLVSRHAGRVAPARSSELNLAFDFPASRILVSLFLSERVAQRTAAALREPGRTGAVAAALQARLAEGLTRALTGAAPGHLCVTQAGAAHQHAAGAAFRGLPQAALARVAGTLAGWSGQRLAEQLPAAAARVVEATEADADGVTLTIALDAPPGIGELRAALGGGGVDPAMGWATAAAPEARIDVVPGFHRA